MSEFHIAVPRHGRNICRNLVRVFATLGSTLLPGNGHGKPRTTPARLRHVSRALAICALALSVSACQRAAPPDWKLTDVSGHLPDLQFTLTGDNGKPMTEAAFKGDVTLVFFGYTHCPDVCPETMARLAEVMQQLGHDADHIRIAFISVDPRRDTPPILHAYVQAFDAAHAVGLTGSDSAIAELARRYRVAYELGKPGPDGNYEVTHSAAIYIFDPTGHIRLIATDSDTAAELEHDLRELVHSTR